MDIDAELEELGQRLASKLVEHYQGDAPMSLESIVQQLGIPELETAMQNLQQLGELGDVKGSKLTSKEQKALKDFVQAAQNPVVGSGGLLGILAKKKEDEANR